MTVIHLLQPRHKSLNLKQVLRYHSSAFLEQPHLMQSKVHSKVTKKCRYTKMRSLVKVQK